MFITNLIFARSLRRVTSLTLFSVIALLLSPSCAVIFQCHFRSTSWVVIGSRYTCDVTLVESENDTHVTEVTGDHLEYRDNEDVEVINVLDQYLLEMIPKDIEKFFPNLIGIRWYHGTLIDITADDLTPFPYLRLLSLRGNKIVIIDEDLFVATPRIEYVSFRENLIEHVGENILDSLPHISEILFENNVCIDQNARTQRELEELGINLATLCPPMERSTVQITTEAEVCSVACSQLLDDLERNFLAEADEIKQTNADQSQKITELKEMIASYEQRFDELEERLNEIGQSVS